MLYHKTVTFFVLTATYYVVVLPGQTCARQRPLFSTTMEHYSLLNFEKLLAGNTEHNPRVAIADLIEALMSSSYPTAVAEGISEKCKADSIEYVENIFQNRSIWALQMKESSGSLPIGFYALGNYRADGLFDECLAVRAPNFDGEYCTIFLNPVSVNLSEVANETLAMSSTENRQNLISVLQILGQLSGPEKVKPRVEGATVSVAFLPSISFCLPSSCTAQDLGQAVAQLIGSYVIANHSIVIIADEGFCFEHTDKPKEFDGADITVTAVLSSLGLLVLVATIHESFRLYTESFDAVKSETLTSKVLLCFSLVNNSRKLLSMKGSNSSESFGCIHGIRVFSMSWVVLGHVFYFGPTRLALNQAHLMRDAVHWAFQTVSNATVAVDTFFVMSGLLASYLLLRELDRSKGKINLFLLYLHRYLRLTIVYAVVLGFVATLIVYVSTGPNWFYVPVVSKYCREHWWQSLLYLNNLYPSSEGAGVCMGHTWYLAVDMQLFLISPIIIYPLWRWKTLGPLFLAVATLATLASDFIVYALYNLPPTSIITRTDFADVMDEFNDKYYVKPWTRAPPYFVGIWAGWILYVTRNSYFRLPKRLVAGFWILATSIALAVLYGLAPYADQNKTPSIPGIVSMTYGPLHRTAWGVAIGWVIFACSRGYGGVVNRILSWEGFMPLARLTYCAYLIHIDFLNVYFETERRLYYYSFYGQLVTYMGLLLTILGLAFVISVTIEAPFLNLEKLIFHPEKRDGKNIVQRNNPYEDSGRTSQETNDTAVPTSSLSEEQ